MKTSFLYLQTLAMQLMMSCNEGGRITGEMKVGEDKKLSVRIGKKKVWSDEDEGGNRTMAIGAVETYK